jgi:hypothetical protein
MGHSTSAGTLVANARRRILRALDRGETLTLADLPHRWPETRVLVRQLVDELVGGGEVDVADGSRVPGRPGFRITPRGRARLRGFDVAAD